MPAKVTPCYSPRIVTLQEFKDSCTQENPPEGLSRPLMALWYDFKGDWERSHEIAQEINSKIGYRIHGYLHQKEGDLHNAAYWYRRASQLGKKMSSFEHEWEEIAISILKVSKFGD